jgi:hypothetical protein
MTPQEPYDITPIPLFLWEPSLTPLLLLALTGTTAILLFRMWRRRRTPLRWNAVRREIEQIIDARGSDRASTVSLRVRRYLSEVLDQPLASMTPREIRTLQAQSSPPESRVLDLVLSLEAQRWGGHAPEGDDHYTELLAAMDRLASTKRGS